MKLLFSRKKEPKKRLWSIELPILLLIVSAVFALQAFYEASRLDIAQEKFETMEAKAEAAAAERGSRIPLRAQDPQTAVYAPAILSQYAELAQQNPEFYGWIKIDNTNVNYPVMHTPNDPEKYLQLNFEGEYSRAGTIFMDHRCSAESDNLILYGHNMKNKTMFGSILNYKDAAYWREHPVIQFDTLYEHREYEVLAAFFDHVYNKSDTCFKYYNFIEAADTDAFNKAIRIYREKAIYDTGVSVQYGDQLLTLSTCAYHTENGRFAVIARRCQVLPQNKGE